MKAVGATDLCRPLRDPKRIPRNCRRQRLRRPSLKRPSSKQQFIRANTERPPVTLPAVPLPRAHFWRHVCQRPGNRRV